MGLDEGRKTASVTPSRENSGTDMTPEDQWLLQKERMLAWVRLGFSIAAILVIQLNPARAAKFPLLSHLSLFIFFLYSLLVVYFVRRARIVSRKFGLITTCLDLPWISLVVFSTGGSRTPFFVYYLFPVITAGSRYGIKGGVSVALIGVVLYGFIRFSPIWENPLAIDTFIIRSIYLLVLAYIFGFISEFERNQNERLIALYRTAGEAAAREERRRIARELHDRLLQVLGSLTLHLETCRRHLMSSPTELARELELMEEVSRGSMKEIRQFLAGKDVQSWIPGTLVEKLKEEIAFLRDGLGMKVVFETNPEDLNFFPEVEQEIFLILAEGIRNIARHSRGSVAEIQLRGSRTEIVGSVTDNGVGFDRDGKREEGGYGLTTMEERVKRLGGEFLLETSLGKGAKISFTIPKNTPARPLDQRSGPGMLERG
ncbi:MAG: hypothetical protein HY695_25305 [Deltaproteobacteria bacterium]|nr:hypothetical protein [Deltaproteobacteria bacterium]